DPLVAERPARGLHVVDLLRQAVAGQIDTGVRQSVRAGPERVAVGAKELLAEKVGRVLERRLDLRAVQPGGAVDASVADEDDVMIIREPASLAEFHLRESRAAYVAEDRYTLVRSPRTDAAYVELDRLRLSLLF